MGNTSTKEARQAQDPSGAGPSSARGPGGVREGSRLRSRSNRSDLGGLLGLSGPATIGSGSGHGHGHGHGHGSASGSGHGSDRRETRQEREARRLERERQARLVERERSMREENVDGGYLVTLGTYVGPEDFNKTIVRQLQIERRLAPFWRGLNDFSPTWTEYQIAAAARGLDVPPPDQPPPDGFFFSRPPTAVSGSPPKSSSGSHATLAVPAFASASASAAAPASLPSSTSHGAGALSGALSASASASNLSSTPPAGSLPVGSPSSLPPHSPSGGSTTPRGHSSSPFKPRAKALAAALSVGSRNGSSTDMTPREIQLPNDPYVNGQPIEVFLYKDADECPICFLSYPPYLNQTRCCGQPICSECFVQIKRPEPHYPEGHGDGATAPADMHPEEQAGQLISEPACCPYCQQPEFGVTYDPPPFRRGLVYAGFGLGGLGLGSFGSLGSLGSVGNAVGSIGSMGAAMSSNSSVNSALTPGGPSQAAGSPPATPVPHGSRRRTQSLSANAPNVVTTDRVRPDWATKLAAQRAHIARRAAAATALHTAAFLLGTQESRPFRVSRFGRRNTSSNNLSGDASPGGRRHHGDGAAAGGGSGGGGSGSGSIVGLGSAADLGDLVGGGGGVDGADGDGDGTGAAMEPGPRSSSGRGLDLSTARRNRMEDLEELMFREALRQSLATEEERRRKEEKEARKEAKRREKEERRAAKAMAKRQGSGGSGGLYSASGAGTDSGPSSASASSLSLSGLSSGLGLGSRRRGNSGASNLRVEASVANANATAARGGGGGVAAAATGSSISISSGGTSPMGPTSPTGEDAAAGADAEAATSSNSSGGGGASHDKGKGVERGLPPTAEAAETDGVETSHAAAMASSLTSSPRSTPTTPNANTSNSISTSNAMALPSAGPSHLRQMSVASSISVSSSVPDSAAGSLPNHAPIAHLGHAGGGGSGGGGGGSSSSAYHTAHSLHLQDPHASGLSLGSRSTSDDGDGPYDSDPTTSAEPLFNFGSLAAVVGVQIEGKHAGRRLSVIEREENGAKGAAGGRSSEEGIGEVDEDLDASHGHGHGNGNDTGNDNSQKDGVDDVDGDLTENVEHVEAVTPAKVTPAPTSAPTAAATTVTTTTDLPISLKQPMPTVSTEPSYDQPPKLLVTPGTPRMPASADGFE